MVLRFKSLKSALALLGITKVPPTERKRTGDGFCVKCRRAGVETPTGSITRRFCDGCRPSKYRAQKVCFHGRWFHSRSEAERSGELELLAQGGAIRNLRWQVPFDLVVGGMHVCTYIADFVYEEPRSGGTQGNLFDTPLSGWTTVVEDRKGLRTDYYKLKARLFAAVMGFSIRET